MVLKIEAGRDAKPPHCLWDAAAILHSLEVQLDAPCALPALFFLSLSSHSFLHSLPFFCSSFSARRAAGFCWCFDVAVSDSS